jgi:hypothetical protein
MRQRELIMALIASSLVITPVAGAAPPADQRLAITETDDSFRLSVPVSRLVMTIPRGDFTVVHESGSGGSASSRYFHLEDASHGIIISGWFESSQSYGGIKKFWKGETDAWKKNHLPEPKNTSIIKIDNWDVVLYDMKVPDGSNTHIRSEWVQLGTWIDVHISVTSADPIDAAREKAMRVLKGIRITEAS